MSKIMKKISGLALAVILALAMVMPAAAAADSLPSESDTATITVTGIEAEATVTAYRIVRPVYTDGGGYSGYEAVLNDSIKDVVNPTAAEIFALAGRKADLTDKVVMTQNGNDYTATVKAGTWMVLVEGNGKSLAKVYNPMIVSATYKDNTLNSGAVSGSDRWTLNGDKTVVKATEPTVKKVIVNDDDEEVKGDDKAVGDTINFKVKSQIPSYGTEYKDVVYKLTDVLSKGLTLNQDSIAVKVEGQVVAEAGDTFKITIMDQGYVINFAENYIRSNGQSPVEVTYSAVLNEKASSGYDADTNTITLDYSTNFNGETSSKTDKTRHYTFGIDSSLTGESGVTTITKTHEIIKVDANTYKEEIYTDEEYTAGIPGALAGAEFTLYKADGETVVKTAESSGTGHLEFTGLDAGSYVLKETKAPSGYKVDETPHTVVITAEYNSDGTLKSHKVTIDGQATSTYKATYNGEGSVTKIEKTTEGTSTFKNTKVGELPSTGGMGTYLFTIVGVFIMASAAGMLILRRKRG